MDLTVELKYKIIPISEELLNHIFLQKNAPVKIDISKGQITSANDSRAHLKRGRPVGFKN